ncbi:unnamed protein product [Lactuca saligna]|uniref:Uncharacterized protein n=1 Tax=Lactuca saligna TaxID=75948 RepID=A0AA36E6I8_LACSI|nr:unnamed protein product [Lactuca saligna]
MVPDLTSNPFHLATTPHTSLASLKNTRRLIVSAKKSDVSSARKGEIENRFQFNFDFGKIHQRSNNTNDGEMLLVYCLVGDAEKETKMESDDREALLVKQIARMSNRPPTTLCGSFLVVGDHQSRGKGSSLIDGGSGEGLL